MLPTSLAFVAAPARTLFAAPAAPLFDTRVTPPTSPRPRVQMAVSRRGARAPAAALSSEELRHCVDSSLRRRAARRAKFEQRVSHMLGELSARSAELRAAARSALHASEWRRAEHLFVRAIASDPVEPRSYLLLALLTQRRDAALAREAFRLGARVAPTDAALLQAWGLFENKQGHTARAVRLLRYSAVLEPRNARVLRWKCFANVPVKGRPARAWKRAAAWQATL